MDRAPPHGFGFAAVLRDIGLPQTELPTVLLFFIVGVEIGQILFVIALLAAFFCAPGYVKRIAFCCRSRCKLGVVNATGKLFHWLCSKQLDD